MNAAVFTSSALSLPISFCKTRSSQVTRKKGEFRVFAVFGEDSGLVEKKNQWGHLFDVEDPRSKTPPPPYKGKGKFMDVNQALEVARLDIQYLDWRARQDLLTIMLLHDKVVDVLNPLAREYKSIGTVKKELAGLQEELAKAHQHVLKNCVFFFILVLTCSNS